MMTNRLKLAVVGAGAIGTGRHLPAYKMCETAGVADLVAVCDPFLENAQRAQATFAIPRAFADYHELFKLPGLDAISICTPNVSHEPIALAALEAGLHVMCEKPLAMSLAGAQRMADAAREAERKTAVNFRYRWIPAAGFVHDIIQSGELGEIYHVYVNYFNGSHHDPATPIRWRQLRSESGTGVLGDLASHLIDLCRYWIGEFTEVNAHLRTIVPERPLIGGGTGIVDTDDSCSFFAKLANGAEGVFNASRCATARGNHQRAEIYGTKGALIYEIEKHDRGGDQVQLCLGSSQASHAVFANVPVPPDYLTRTPFRPMIDFVEAIQENRDPSPNFEDGVRCQAVIEAAEISAHEGKWTSVPT